MDLDGYRRQLLDEQRSDAIRLSVDWAPAYELLLSLSIFCNMKPHSLVELGPVWLRTVQAQLSADAVAHVTRKSAARLLKHDEELLALLVYACPGERDAAGFLDWFSQLTPGVAYEAVAPFAPEPGPKLPRDFTAWRDTVLDLLGAWQADYFRHIDPAIHDGLRAEAEALRDRIKTEPYANHLVEEVTNGLVVEQSDDCRSVILVPQYHHRPYNTHVCMQDGVLILYPVDVLPAPADVPPPSLIRLTHALSDESRLRILRFLANGPCTLTEAARFAGLSQPTVHHHLTQLRAAGLVRVHFALSGPSRYSLRPHALEQLSQQLGAYLEMAAP